MKHLVGDGVSARTKLKGAPRHLREAAKALASVVGWPRVGVLEVERCMYSGDAGITSRLPGLVVWPDDTAEVAAVVGVCRDHDLAFTARGAGTGLSGGAVGLSDGVVISTARMDSVLEIDPVCRIAWVQPGVVNSDLSRATESFGLHFAPDPSSQSVCTIGGNVAENSGGPHCLRDGSTNAHILAVEVVLSSGEIVMLGSLAGESVGFDLRGVFVGSEGMCGIATRIAVRLVANPVSVATLLASFPTVNAAAAATSAVIAAGIVPAALELMDAPMCTAVAAFLGTADYPTDGSTVLLVEVDGLPETVETQARAIEKLMSASGATRVNRATDPAQAQRFWKGRKSSFGAVARIAPNYYLHDCVVPRTKLATVLGEIERIADDQGLVIVNVFHAGDGNLHPLIVYDASVSGVGDRVDAAGAAIVEACVAAGGSLTGEHGVGLEKQRFMSLMFSEDDLSAQAAIPRAFDPAARANPDKVFPGGSRCGDVRTLQRDAVSASGTGLWA